jgi:hypothetical protein
MGRTESKHLTKQRKMQSSLSAAAPDENEGRRDFMMAPASVPDFFQEETPDALRCQVDWLAREIDVDDSFFARLLRTDEATISNWRRLDTTLPAGGNETLQLLWRTMLHLLSFLNFDQARVRDLFQHTTLAGSTIGESPLIPPWGTSSLKAYLEASGVSAIEKVDGWVTGLRFGDPYAA